MDAETARQERIMGIRHIVRARVAKIAATRQTARRLRRGVRSRTDARLVMECTLARFAGAFLLTNKRNTATL
jgi:hypothetical protein